MFVCCLFIVVFAITSAVMNKVEYKCMQDRSVLAFKLKLGKLTLGKIIKIVATRCHILKPKCIKFDFGCGFVPDPAEEAYSALPGPLAGFKGPSKGREGRGEGRKGYGKGVPYFQFSLLATLWPCEFLAFFCFCNRQFTKIIIKNNRR